MEPPSTQFIAILNESGRRMPVSLIRRAVAFALDSHGHASATVSVLLTTDEHVRELNRTFRHVDEPTDVLSFPAGSLAEKLLPGAPLGDIAIAIPYAERQARARKVSLSQEIAYLAIHGTLHLVGFDDLTDNDRAKMIDAMNEVAVGAGLKPDYAWSSILHDSEGAPS